MLIQVCGMGEYKIKVEKTPPALYSQWGSWCSSFILIIFQMNCCSKVRVQGFFSFLKILFSLLESPRLVTPLKHNPCLQLQHHMEKKAILFSLIV